MQTTVTIKGWRAGLLKISLVKLIQKDAKYSLRQAKRAVEDVLEGKSVELPMPSQEAAEAFVNEAESLGAICELKDRA